jgi:N-acetylglutamate synthase-like GNAT family acetyltransferase
MIRPCEEKDYDAVCEIINDAAKLYKGVIPEELYKEPYMTIDKLKKEIEDGVNFWIYEENDQPIGVMGIQHVKDVTLIRHAYVLREKQKQGIGTKLLNHLIKLTDKPILIGTWAKAYWAIHFYQKNGFKLVSQEEKDELLKKYWSLPDLQIQTSVVLANKDWFQLKEKAQK